MLESRIHIPTLNKSKLMAYPMAYPETLKLRQHERYWQELHAMARGAFLNARIRLVRAYDIAFQELRPRFDHYIQQLEARAKSNAMQFWQTSSNSI